MKYVTEILPHVIIACVGFWVGYRIVWPWVFGY